MNASKQISLGSIPDGQAYYGTTTDSTWSTDFKTRTLKAGPGVLGSIVYVTAGTSDLVIYDATTTDTSKRSSTMSTSSIIVARFTPNSITPGYTEVTGTYTFDRSLVNGLTAEITGTLTQVATTTITWR